MASKKILPVKVKSRKTGKVDSKKSESLNWFNTKSADLETRMSKMSTPELQKVLKSPILNPNTKEKKAYEARIRAGIPGYKDTAAKKKHRDEMANFIAADNNTWKATIKGVLAKRRKK